MPVASHLGSVVNKDIACVFPQAPSIDGMPAWWKIDVMEWMKSMQGDGVAQLIR